MEDTDGSPMPGSHQEPGTNVSQRNDRTSARSFVAVIEHERAIIAIGEKI